MPRTRWLKISYPLTKPPCHPIIGQMRVSDEVSKTGGHLIEDLEVGRRRRRHYHGTRSFPAETAPFCHCVLPAAAAVAPASAKQKNGWRCSSRSMHEWCEDLHYWKLLSIIEQIICVLIQLPSSYYSFWRAHEWIIAISVKLVVAAAAAVQPAHELMKRTNELLTGH
jgi:hypothetical protein